MSQKICGLNFGLLIRKWDIYFDKPNNKAMKTSKVKSYVNMVLFYTVLETISSSVIRVQSDEWRDLPIVLTHTVRHSLELSVLAQEWTSMEQWAESHAQSSQYSCIASHFSSSYNISISCHMTTKPPCLSLSSQALPHQILAMVFLPSVWYLS
jgi:hypothetical protein